MLPLKKLKLSSWLLHLPSMSALDKKLLELLVCPLTRCSLEYDKTGQELISKVAKLAYPIKNGIPIMLPDEARSLASTENGNSKTNTL